MSSLSIDHGELVRMRANVSQHIHSLEVCWRCDRVSECGLSLIKGSTTVWLCSKCSSDKSYRRADLRGAAIMAPPPRAWELHKGDQAGSEMEIATARVWMRRCSGCNAILKKATLSDTWICGKCGRDKSA
jgi:hypothetical protein